MNTVLHSPNSVAHLLAALIATVAGTYILFTPKGTTRHRLTGHIYSLSMAFLLFTAFQLYYLFGRFGIVHWGAIGSVAALTVGLGSIWLRPFTGSWLRWHYLGMGFSITGLYASFVVESTYRFFAPVYFWWVTLGLTAVVFSMGSLLLYRHYPTWAKQTNRPSSRIILRASKPVISSTD